VNRILRLENTVQEYAWGSYSAIPELLGRTVPSNNPQAELWIGAHPRSPSSVNYGEEWIDLKEFIEKYPNDILGKKIAMDFENKLPYLLKILAIEKPLSLQAHPDTKQAKEGFDRENRMGIPIDAPNRNYRDANHKPECICALTDFWAMNGFRKADEILLLLKKICPENSVPEIAILDGYRVENRLKEFFTSFLTMEPSRKTALINEALPLADEHADDHPAFKWIGKLAEEYPADTGIISPLFLNLVKLTSGQAMFLSAGKLHAYLSGVGVELMANSDNVLRGGLTPKHVDVRELINVLNFNDDHISILEPGDHGICEKTYKSHAREFVLSVISLRKGVIHECFQRSSVEILLCVDGEAMVNDTEKSEKLDIKKGDSILVPAAAGPYIIDGNAILYKAAVPV